MPADLLRVFLNASTLPERPAGAGIYTLELAAALARRGDVDLTVAAPRPHAMEGAAMLPAPSGALIRAAWEQLGMPAAIRTTEAAVYHGAHFSTGPPQPGAPRGNGPRPHVLPAASSLLVPSPLLLPCNCPHGR